MTEEELDRVQKDLDRFADDFAAVVRKYVPNYPGDQADDYLLMRMQENTSVYSPYIWS